MKACLLRVVTLQYVHAQMSGELWALGFRTADTLQGLGEGEGAKGC